MASGFKLGLGLSQRGVGGALAADPVLTLVADNLDQDPPEYSLNSDTAGTLRWDFHASATPPAAGSGDIGTGTESVGAGNNTLTLDLSGFAGETGYLHFRIGTSNVLTSQQFTVPTPATVPAAFQDADWSVATGATTGGQLDVTIATLPDNGGATITDVEYDLDASGTWVSSGGTTSFTITGLTASTSYAVRLRAANSVGAGTAGNSESATSSAAASGFDPASLFGASEPGFFLDFATGNVFTDTARTTSAGNTDTAAGATDLSGNGNHFAQPTSGDRPVFNTGTGGYLQFDGLGDHLERTTATSTGTDDITVFAVVQKEKDSEPGRIVTTKNNGFRLLGPTSGASSAYAMNARDFVGSVDRIHASAVHAQPHAATLLGYAIGDGATEPSVILRVNGVETFLPSGTVDRSTAPTDEIYIGANQFGNDDYGGRIYALLVIGRALTSGEISDLEAWGNARRGA